MRQASQIVNEFLEAFYGGQFDRAQMLVADGFCYEWAELKKTGKEGFFSTAEGLAPYLRGYRLMRQWEDGESVTSLYEVRIETAVGSGVVLMSAQHTVRNGLLVAGKATLDNERHRGPVSPTEGVNRIPADGPSPGSGAVAR